MKKLMLVLAAGLVYMAVPAFAQEVKTDEGAQISAQAQNVVPLQDLKVLQEKGVLEKAEANNYYGHHHHHHYYGGHHHHHHHYYGGHHHHYYGGHHHHHHHAGSMSHNDKVPAPQVDVKG